MTDRITFADAFDQFVEAIREQGNIEEITIKLSNLRERNPHGSVSIALAGDLAGKVTFETGGYEEECLTANIYQFFGSVDAD